MHMQQHLALQHGAEALTGLAKVLTAWIVKLITAAVLQQPGSVHLSCVHAPRTMVSRFALQRRSVQN